jgi:hypothetical protein
MLSLMIAAALAASPADDPTTPTPRQPDTAAVAGTGGSAGAAAKSARRYCVKETYTGSRVPKKSCYTREEWLNQGWDPLEVVKK